MAASNLAHAPAAKTGEPARRDFLVLTGTAFAAVGAASFVWPLIDSLNPAADTLALASVEVDLGPVAEGMAITVLWQGKPLFIRHRTADEITKAKDDDKAVLKDPQSDAERVQKPEWLVMVGVCTHLGCIPLGQKTGEVRGEFGGWFCPCHGSAYDTSGRIRKGPAPRNLEIPPYTFLSPTRIKVG